MLKSDWTTFKINTESGNYEHSNYIIDVIGHQNAVCTFSTVNTDDGDVTLSVPDYVELTGDNGQSLTARLETMFDYEIIGELEPDIMQFGDDPLKIFGNYSGSFTATLVY